MKIKCCKCENLADKVVTISGKDFFVCDNHIPSVDGMTIRPSINKTEESDLITILKQNNHICKLQGKEYVLFGGLLWLAHANGLQKIETEIIEHNRQEGFCLIRATVVGTRGTFTAYGDADPKTVGKKIADAYIRMAETRSVARALRFYTGIGMTAMEELPPNTNEK